MPALRFFYGPFEVGVFSGDSYPHEPGIFGYTPVEGDGHEELQLARRGGAEPRCHFDADGQRITFTVRSSPRYGRLELSDFASAPVPTEESGTR